VFVAEYVAQPPFWRSSHSGPKPQTMPPWLLRKFIAFMQRTTGPRGLEFARWAIEFKLIRNLNYVREKFPKMEGRVVPYHVYEVLKPYAEVYEQVYGQALEKEGRP